MRFAQIPPKGLVEFGTSLLKVTLIPLVIFPSGHSMQTQPGKLKIVYGLIYYPVTFWWKASNCQTVSIAHPVREHCCSLEETLAHCFCKVGTVSVCGRGQQTPTTREFAASLHPIQGICCGKTGITTDHSLQSTKPFAGCCTLRSNLHCDRKAEANMLILNVFLLTFLHLICVTVYHFIYYYVWKLLPYLALDLGTRISF